MQRRGVPPAGAVVEGRDVVDDYQRRPRVVAGQDWQLFKIHATSARPATYFKRTRSSAGPSAWPRNAVVGGASPRRAAARRRLGVVAPPAEHERRRRVAFRRGRAAREGDSTRHSRRAEDG